jgi:hypothetical protein
MIMKVRPLRALIWGGMFVLAYVGGSWLGRYVVAGVDVAPVNAMTGLVLRPAHEAANEAVAARSPEQQFRDGGPANHVCTGCDAGETRYRQMAQQMGLPVADDTDDAGDDAEQDQSGAFAEQ